MIQIREFIRAGGGLSDSQLSTVIKEQILRVPPMNRQDWMRQAELSLDGYGGATQLLAVERVRAALKQLELDLNAGQPLIRRWG